MAHGRSSGLTHDGTRIMKNEAHPSADLTKLGELIEGIEVAMLTTHAADGSMVSRPLQTLELDASGNLVFFTAADSRKLEDLAANPDVNLAYANPKKQVYVSVRGTARIDRDRATIDALWSPMQKVFFPAGKHDPNLVVLRIRVRDAAYWESAGNFVARALDFAAGMLSHEPRDLGRHGTLAGNG
jgi:general stress protein 26